MQINAIEKKAYTLIEINTEEAISPSDLPLTIPDFDPKKGVVVSGRAPLWLYGYLSHELHVTPWVGFHDPRLGGAVVIHTHSPLEKIGNIVPLD